MTTYRCEECGCAYTFLSLARMCEATHLKTQKLYRCTTCGHVSYMINDHGRPIITICNGCFGRGILLMRVHECLEVKV